VIIRLEHNTSIEETEIIIRYPVMSKEVERIAAMLQSANTRIRCNDEEGRDKFINVSDVFYFESVERVIFAYCEQDVYKTDLRLYQVVEDYANLGFVQISKSCVLNINMLDSITPLLNSRMEATLKNGERIHITRKYLENIRKALLGGSI